MTMMMMRRMMTMMMMVLMLADQWVDERLQFNNIREDEFKVACKPLQMHSSQCMSMQGM